MLVIFEDAASLAGGRTAEPLRLFYPMQQTLSLELVWGDGREPVPAEALGCALWELAVTRSLDTPADVLCSASWPENIFTGNSCTLSFSTATMEMYRHAAGGRPAPVVFTLTGREDGEELPSVCVQLPAYVYSIPELKQPADLSTELLRQLQWGAAAAGAAAERCAAILQEVLRARGAAETAASRAASEALAQASERLQPYVAEAERAAVLSESYARGGTGTRPGEDTDNAKYYMEQAKEAAEG